MRFTDSDALAFLQSQLTHLTARVFEKKFAAIIYPELMPVTNEASEFAESITTHFLDGFTSGEFVGSGGDDIPFSRVAMDRDIIPVRYGGIGFEYSIDELRVSQALNRDLSILSAERARRGFEEHAQRVAFFGNAAAGLEGLFNHTAVATGAASATLPTALGTSGDAVAAIFNEAIDDIIETTKEIEIPDTVLLPSASFNLLAANRLDTAGSPVTILQYLRTNNNATARTGQPLTIRPIAHLDAEDKMVVYSSSEEVMAYHIPMELRFLPPQPRNLMIRVPGEYKLAGLELRFPGAVRYRTGVL